MDSFVPVIAKIVNLSLASGCFSDHWKHAIVLPLLKKQGLDLSYGNYRPVSNLSFVSKIFVKAALSQFCDHMEQNNLLPSCQSAYRKDFSTETALLKVCNEILCNMDNNHVTMMVMLDLSAAFDTVDHDILLSVLDQNFGTKGLAKSWFDCYLRPRTQSVQVGECISTKSTVHQGVPQGSCAGPVLFTAYASTLYHTISSHLPEVMGYADDHALYLKFKPGNSDSELSALNAMESCLLDVKAWMNMCRLKMNDTKTEFLIFGSRTQLAKLEIDCINVDSSIINCVNDVKYLGVYLDNTLSMKKHINEKCKIASFNLYNIRKLRKHLSTDSTRTLVQALVTSHFDYCNSLFYGLPSSSLNKLQRVQNMAARIILNLNKYDSISSAFKLLHWLPIKDRIDFKILSLTYKALHGSAPSYLKDLLKPRSVSYSIRSHDSLILTTPRTRCKSLGDRSFCVCAPKLWNALPFSIRNSSTVSSFKSSLKTFIFTRVYN